MFDHASLMVTIVYKNIAYGSLLGLQIPIERAAHEWGEATRSFVKAQRRNAGRATFQGKIYNFLERPAGFRCFIYHFVV